MRIAFFACPAMFESGCLRHLLFLAAPVNKVGMQRFAPLCGWEMHHHIMMGCGQTTGQSGELLVFKNCKCSAINFLFL